MLRYVKKYSILTALLFLYSASHAKAKDVVCQVGIGGIQDTVLSAVTGDTLDVWTQSTQGAVWHVSRDSGRTWYDWAYTAGSSNHQRFVLPDSLAGKVLAFMVRGSPYADSYSGLVAIVHRPVSIRPRGASAPVGAAARLWDVSGRPASGKSFYTLRSEWNSKPSR
jgi:hypothetical protein